MTLAAQSTEAAVLAIKMAGSKKSYASWVVLIDQIRQRQH